MLKKEEKEARRNQRIGLVMACVSVLIAAALTIYKFETKIGVNVPIEHLNCWFVMETLMAVPLGCVLVIIFDAVCFVTYDIRRYNLLEGHIKRADNFSDRYYDDLVKDFVVSQIIIVVSGVAWLLVSDFLQGELCDFISHMILVVVCLGVILYQVIKKHVKVRGYKDNVIRTSCAIVMALFVLIIPFVKSNYSATIKYTKNGSVLLEESNVQ